MPFYVSNNKRTIIYEKYRYSKLIYYLFNLQTSMDFTSFLLIDSLILKNYRFLLWNFHPTEKEEGADLGTAPSSFNF